MKKIIILFLLSFCLLSSNKAHATNEILPSFISTNLNAIESGNHAQWQRILSDIAQDETYAASHGGQLYWYGQKGLRYLAPYIATGTVAYCTSAVTIGISQLGTPPADGNAMRSDFLKEAIIYSNCADVVSASLKATMLSKLTQWSRYVRGLDGGRGTRYSDTDESLGHGFGALVFAYAVRDENLSLSNEIINYFKVDYNAGQGYTWRNTIHDYVVAQATGGEWLESSTYNDESIILLCAGVEFVNAAAGSDKFPEVTALYDDFAAVWAQRMYPGLTEYGKWGDIQSDSATGLRKFTAMGTYLMLAELGENANTAYLGNNTFYTTQGIDDWAFLFFNPYATQTAPSGQSAVNASGMGINYWRTGMGGSDMAVMDIYKTQIYYTDHEFDYYSNINIWKDGNFLLNNPKKYGDGEYGSEHYNSTGLIPNGMAFGYSETRGPVAIKNGSNYTFHVGLRAGIQQESGRYVAAGEHLKEHTSYRFVRSNANGTATVVFYDRMYNCDPSTCASVNNYDSVLLGQYNANSGKHIWQIHAENAISNPSTDKYTWTAKNGNTVTFETKMSGYTASNLTPETMASTYGGTIDSSLRRYALRLLMPKTTAFQTMLNFFYDGTQTTSRITSSSGEAAVGAYYEAGSENVLFIASAIQPTYPAPTAWSGDGRLYYDSNKRSKVEPLRLFTQGYTISVTTDGNAVVYFADLDPAKTWKYKVDGGSEQSLSVDSSTMGIASLTLSSATHSIQVYNTGSSLTCSNSCGFCADQSTCEASAAICYWNGSACTIPPAAICGPTHLELCLTSVECVASSGYWCDENNDTNYSCESSSCSVVTFGFENDDDMLAAYNFSETSGDLLDVSTADAVSDDGTLTSMGTRNGSTYVFDGDAYITIADSAENDFDGSSSNSICMKFKANSVSGTQILYSKGDFVSGDNSYTTYLDDDSIVSELFDSSESTSTSWNNSLTTDSFKYLCAVRNIEAGKLLIYENATLRSEQDDDVGDTESTSDLLLGSYCVDTDTSLEGFWKLNDNAASSTVVDTQGTYNGTLKASNSTINTSTVTTTGKVSSGFTFNGSTNTRNVDLGSVLHKEKTSEFSVSAWIKTSDSSNEMMIISGLDNDVFQRGWAIDVLSGRIWVLMIGSISGYPSFDGWFVKDLGHNIADNNWHHIIVTYDGSNTRTGVKIYVDNSEAAEYTYEGTSGAISNSLINTASVTIGARRGSSGSVNTSFNGVLDNISIYDKVLTSTERSDLYNSGSGTETAPATTVSASECPATTTPNRPSIEVDDFFILGRAITPNEQQQWIDAGGFTDTPPTSPAPSVRKVLKGVTLNCNCTF